MSDNKKVAAAATVKNAVSLEELALIGTFGTEANRSALVRHPSGKVEKVRMGESVGASRVVAISRDSLFLRSGANTKKLEMPKG